VPDASPRTKTARQFVKLCDLADFGDLELRRTIDELVPGHPPDEQVHRKYWEWAMLALYLEHAGAVTEGAAALGVAAGSEPPLFWLANRVERVVATDIYGEGSFAGREAAATMLTDPAAFAPFPYRRDHLEVRHMDALALDFPDASFDIVFCLSSIEHFGGPRSAARAAAEMARVLRPGGQLVITTECLLGHHPLDSPLVQFGIRLVTFGRRCGNVTPTSRVLDVFDEKEIRRYLIDHLAGAGVDLVQPLDLSISAESFDNPIEFGAENTLSSRTGRMFPHVVLKSGPGSPWTSIFLAFSKRG
jgi:SAM-dependent methyltransferase